MSLFLDSETTDTSVFTGTKMAHPDRCFGNKPLHGKSKEWEKIVELYSIFKNQTTESEDNDNFVIIEGEVGVGKTFFSESFRSYVEQDGAICLSGKFNAFESACGDDESQEVFTTAVGNLVERIVEQGTNVVEFRNILRNELTHQQNAEHVLGLSSTVAVLQKVLEINEKIEKDGPTSLTLTRPNFVVSTGNQLKYSVCFFLEKLSLLYPSVVVILDNLQWMDSTSRHVLNYLLEDKKLLRKVFFVGTSQLQTNLIGTRNTSRGNIPPPFFCAKKDPSLIRLQSLEGNDFIDFVSNLPTISGDTICEPFANQLWEQTKGNPLFTELSLIDCNVEQSGTGGVNSFIEQPVYHSLSELIQSKISCLPPDDEFALKSLVCMGSVSNFDVLRHLIPLPNLIRLLKTSQLFGRLLHFQEEQSVLKFVNSSAQMLIYQNLTDDERISYHYNIGKRLWRDLDLDDLDKYIIVVVHHLTLGSKKIASTDESTGVARLCLQAGIRSAQLSEFKASLVFLRTGVGLLTQQSWREDYILCLSLYNAAGEMAYSTGRIDDVNEFTEIAIRNARTFEDTLLARTTQVFALTSTCKIQQANEASLYVLRKLGVSFPRYCTSLSVYIKYKLLLYRLRRKSTTEILSLKTMENPRMLAAMQMLSAMTFTLFHASPITTCLAVFAMVDITLSHGLCAVSCLGFVSLGATICTLDGNVEEAFRIADLGFSIYKMFGAKEWFARISALYYVSLHARKHRIQEVVEPLLNAYRVGLQTGDIEFALLNYMKSWVSQYETIPLPLLHEKLGCVIHMMETYGQEAMISMAASIQEHIESMMSADLFTQSKITKTSNFPRLLNESKVFPLFDSFNEMIRCFWFNDFPLAKQHADECNLLLKVHVNPQVTALIMLYSALVHVAIARIENRRKAPHARKMCRALCKWSVSSPYNYSGKYFLVEAELLALRKQHDLAFIKYVEAISISKEAGSLIDVALANELTAKHLYTVGMRSKSLPYFNEAIQYYSTWGATLKVAHLENEMKTFSFAP